MNEAEKDIEKWLQKANRDLKSAQKLFTFKELEEENICFHLQQACEKLLKAFLVYSNIDFEKTHDLFFLISEAAQINDQFSAIDFRDLNEYAVRFRYPTDSGLPDNNEIQYYFELTKQIQKLVLSLVNFNQ